MPKLPSNATLTVAASTPTSPTLFQIRRTSHHDGQKNYWKATKSHLSSSIKVSHRCQIVQPCGLYFSIFRLRWFCTNIIKKGWFFTKWQTLTNSSSFQFISNRPSSDSNFTHSFHKRCTMKRNKQKIVIQLFLFNQN